MANVAEIVRNDAECSARRWEGAVESAERDGDRDQARRWREQGERCAGHYATAIDAIVSGDLNAAEAALELANALESEAGDNCDAHHALRAVRAVEVAS